MRYAPLPQPDERWINKRIAKLDQTDLGDIAIELLRLRTHLAVLAMCPTDQIEPDVRTYAGLVLDECEL